MRTLKKPLLVLAIFFGLFMLFFLSLPLMGRLLVTEDKPAKSDLIVLLMGSGPDRMLGAVELFHQGYGDGIIMVKNMVRGYDLAVSQGLSIPHDTEIAKEVAVQSGVPAEKIIILPGNALSTQDEALILREYLKSQSEIKSLIITTSKYHSSRSKKIFTKAMASLNQEIGIISCPTPYDDFNPEKWWQRREDLKRGALEYFKLANFYLREQFAL